MNRIMGLVLAILLLAACQPRHPQALVTAHWLTDEWPDSALLLLKQYAAHMDTTDRSATMYYRLLRLRASDRTEAPLTETDSTVEELTSYYDHHERRLRPMAYYYAGRVYRAKGDAPQAMHCYQRALELLPRDSFRLRACSYSQLGYLFEDQYIFSEALNMFRQAYACDSILRDTTGIIYDLRDIGKIYQDYDQFDSCLYYWERALDFINISQNKKGDGIQNYIASAYIDMGRFVDAKNKILPTLKSSPQSVKGGRYRNLLRVYYNIHDYDSVRFYYDSVITYGNIFAKQAAYKIMEQVSLEEDDIANAKMYLRLFEQTEDSVKRKKGIDAVARANALYNYNLREQRNKELEKENSWMMFVIVFFLFGFTSMLIVYILNQKRKHAENKVKTDELINEVKERQVSQEEIINRQKRIRNAIPEVFLKINQKQKLTWEEWKELEEAVNQEFPHFTHHLMALCPMEDNDLHMNLLIKMQVQHVIIAELTNRTKGGHSTTRRNLFLKATGRKGKSSEWDDLVKKL